MLDIFVHNIENHCYKLLQQFSFIKPIKYSLVSFAMLLMFIASPSYAQVFALTSVPDNFTAVYSDTVDPTRTITVTLEPRNTACASFDSAGRARAFATASNPVCDRSIALNFQTSGFALESIAFNDVDDIDGIAPRDAFAANVPGTWSSPTIEIHSFASPPAFADQASRLTNSGGVGTFLANVSGNNPVNEEAVFQLDTPATSIIIYFDDVQGARNAAAFFSLDPIGASINVNSDLETSKVLVSADNAPAEGDIVTFQIDVTNNGPADATNVSLRDELPAGLTATAANGNVTAGSYAVATGIWTIPSLLNGQTVSLTIEGTVDAGRGGQLIQNTTTPAQGDQPDPSTGGDDLSESIEVDNEISADPEDFSSTLFSTNGGTTPSVFDGDTLDNAPFAPSDVIPSISADGGLTGVSINPDGTITIPAGAPIGTFAVVYQICEVGNPTNCATATVTIVVAATVDLAITKTNTSGVNNEEDQPDDTVVSFSTITYTLRVTNNGPDDAIGAVVADNIVSGLTCDAGNAVTISGDGVPSGTFTVSDLTGVGITLGTLSLGQTAILSYDCVVN